MKCARHCRSTRSSSGAATRSRPAAGPWQEITYSVSVRTPEILDKLEKHPIWKQRAEEKARGQQAGILVGTGVACATKNYGTGGTVRWGRSKSLRTATLPSIVRR